MTRWCLRQATLIAAMLYACTLAAGQALAQAQAFPTKPVRIVVPYNAGGYSDLLARTIAPRLSEMWGQPVLVENRGGAGTTIGAAYVAKAPPDGHTLLLSDHAFVISPHLYHKPPYSVVSDLAPVTMLFRSSPVLAMSSAVPAKSFPEFLAYVKSNPGKLAYGSFGNGSYPHMEIEKLKRMAGIDMMHVQYKGGGPALTDLIAGRVALLMGNYTFWEQQEKAGKVKIIAAVTEKRLSVRPDLPTVQELGVPGYTVNVWFGMMAPGGTPLPILNKIHAAVEKILRDPEFNEKFMKVQALEPDGKSPQEFAAMLKNEDAYWAKMVKESGAPLQ